MSAYSFEGNFRRIPSQDLGGVSKKVPREELIQRAALERRQREEFRNQTKAATVIQSFLRSCLSRKKQNKCLREKFDLILANAIKSQAISNADFDLLFRWILTFYAAGDISRLNAFGQLVLKQKPNLLSNLKDNRSKWLHRIEKLIEISVSQICSLVTIDNHQTPITIPLRIAEDFTCRTTYESVFSEKEVTKIVSSIWLHLVRNNFFAKLRVIIDLKVPEPFEPTKLPPTPLSRTLIDLTLRPLSQPFEDSTSAFVIVQHFYEQFINGPFSAQIKFLIFPILTEKAPVNLRPLFILNALVDTKNQKLTVTESVWLLYGVVKLITSNLAQLTNEERTLYLKTLRFLSSVFPDSTAKVEDEEDTDYAMDYTEYSNVPAFRDTSRIVNEVLEIINMPSNVQVLVSMAETSESSCDALDSLSCLCYAMISCHRFAVTQFRLLYTLAFTPNFLRILWLRITNATMAAVVGPPLSLLQILSGGMSIPPTEWDKILPQLTLFCALLSCLLPTLDDVEFYETSQESKPFKFSSMPFTLSELRGMTFILRDVCTGLVGLAYHDTKFGIRGEYKEALKSVRVETSDSDENSIKVWMKLFKSSVQLLRQLHNRDSRRAFCPNGYWISKQVKIPVEKPTNFRTGIRQRRRYQQFRGLRRLTKEELEDGGSPLSTTEIRHITILQEIPFVVPFFDRVKIFTFLMNKDKEETRGADHHFLVQGSTIDVMIRRNYIYEDAFEKLSPDNEPELKKSIRVQLVNAVGLDEAGIDGGGIFREFLGELLKTAFDPNRGFFRSTHDRLLFPNPASQLIVEDYRAHYYFIGRLLGKALYENMLCELPFATFFLAKLLAGERSSDVDIHHLNSLDPLMYKNLVFLKNYDEDVSDLGLDFTVLNSDLGENEVIELKPDGKNIQVTSQNRIEYIHLVADYKLNKQIRIHCTAFKQGMANVIELDWIRMFSPRELQILISGTPNPIDLEDLKKHTNYSGGYSDSHPAIKVFWNVVSEFDETERRQLLKFVTSCSRPPLLGFKNLHPPFCVHFAGKEDRLPSSSTCMNLLKLPEFNEQETMKQKLLYAVTSGVGFELS